MEPKTKTKPNDIIYKDNKYIQVKYLYENYYKKIIYMK